MKKMKKMKKTKMKKMKMTINNKIKYKFFTIYEKFINFLQFMKNLLIFTIY